MLKTLTGLALVAAVALTASGCRIELTLNDKGGGTGHLAYKVTISGEVKEGKLVIAKIAQAK